MEQIGSSRDVLEDTKVKLARVYQVLDKNGLDALAIGRQDNFSWITSGGDSRVVTTQEMGVGYILITPSHKWMVSHWMDGRRLVEEQAPGQDYDLVTLFWHEGSPVDKLLELTKGMKVAADFEFPGARWLGAEITDLHYPLTNLDLKRLRWVGQKSDQILTNIAQELRLGIPEQDVAAQVLSEYALEGLAIDVLIVGFDDRISRYRHSMPSMNRLGRYALLHPAARRWGLHANVTRLVHFGEPPNQIRKAMDGVIYIGATVAGMIKPGLPFSDILQEEKRLYQEVGFPEEWHNHFQGGITGYTLADPTRCLDPSAVTVNRQAYDYFITITGAKFEELTILTDTGVEVASLGEGWPTRSVDTECGRVTIPDVMIR